MSCVRARTQIALNHRDLYRQITALFRILYVRNNNISFRWRCCGTRTGYSQPNAIQEDKINSIEN